MGHPLCELSALLSQLRRVLIHASDMAAAQPAQAILLLMEQCILLWVKAHQD